MDGAYGQSPRNSTDKKAVATLHAAPTEGQEKVSGVKLSSGNCCNIIELVLPLNPVAQHISLTALELGLSKA